MALYRSPESLIVLCTFLFSNFHNGYHELCEYILKLGQHYRACFDKTLLSTILLNRSNSIV